ncbi:hypothetical protein AAMO2058_001181400 [Amorphochlora amoebiformis]
MIWSALIYTSLYVFIIWLSLAVTVGIFYCADLAEEHPTMFGKIIKYSIWVVLGVHLILFLEELPYTYVCIGIAAHGCYYQLLRDYPRIQGLTNPWLLASVGLMVVDNACWLWYFYYHYFSTMEILCFGQILLWLVPFEYVISLSVNDNVLPGSGAYGPGGGMGSRGGSDMSLKNLFVYFGFGTNKEKSGSAPANKPYYQNTNTGGYVSNAVSGGPNESFNAQSYSTTNREDSQITQRGMGGGYSAPMPGNTRPSMPNNFRKFD